MEAHSWKPGGVIHPRDEHLIPSFKNVRSYLENLRAVLNPIPPSLFHSLAIPSFVLKSSAHEQRQRPDVQVRGV